jgi:mono/diheme cytochrome c family protein
MNKDPKEISRDEMEPTMRSGAVYLPMWIVGLLAFLLYWGCNYVDERGDHFDERVYEPYRSVTELSDIIPKDETQEQLKLGKRVYDVCAACHQANGGGNPAQAPPLAGSEWVLTPGPNRILRIPMVGLSGPIKVGNVEMNASMAPFGAQGVMTDEQLAAVLTYVRNSWGNKASRVTVEQVQKVRAEVLKNHPDPYTAEELLKLPDAVR